MDSNPIDPLVFLQADNSGLSPIAPFTMSVFCLQHKHIHHKESNDNFLSKKSSTHRLTTKNNPAPFFLS